MKLITDEKSNCGNCAHCGVGSHRYRGKMTYTPECQSFGGPKKNKRVKYSDWCSFYYPDTVKAIERIKRISK